MKKQKYSVVAGIILFVLAALFSISLLLVAADFGGINPAKNSIFYSLGKMLTGVYGFCSVFIPIFLIVAGIQCFMSKWRIRNGVVLLGSIFPFFTADAIEHICRMLIESETDTVLIVKISSTLLIGLLILIGEYLLLSILGEILESSLQENREFSQQRFDEDKNEIVFFNSDEDEIDEITDDENSEEKESEKNSEENIDLSNDKIFLEQKEILKDLINDGKPAQEPEEGPLEEENSEEETITEDPTIIENEELDNEETIPESVKEDELIDDEDFAEPILPEEPSPFDHIFDEQEKSHEEEISINEEDFQNEYDEMSDARPVDFNENNEFTELEENPEEDFPAEEYELPDEEDTQVEKELPIEDEYIPAQEEIEEESEEEEISFDDFEDNDDSIEFDEISEEPEPELEHEPELDPEPEFTESNEVENPADFINIEDIAEDSNEDTAESEEEPFGVEDIFSQMEADAAANPVIKNQEEEPAHDSLYQQEESSSHVDSEIQEPLRKLSEYKIPTDLLEKFENDEYWRIDDETKQAGENLKQTLNEFGIEAEVTGIRKGPVVTMFELLPAPGVKLSKIVNLQDNIALALAAKSVRIVAPIPGKHAVGIEIPNKERAIVSFREIIEQPLPEFKKMAIPVILGKDISGQSQIIDIAKTPHLLIAGATGAGKSVCVNSIILSILYNRSPRDVKLIMVDPKVVELKLYNDIPHLLTPVVTEPKKALQVLQYCICEMERRYALLDGMGVRDIVSYNTRIRERKIATEKLPYIVVIIDEFADLMATSGKELETSVARLTAMSRAVGIHLVLATQRPSVNVITGLIKANIPSRIAFMVASRTDSNIIIDAVGAEKLLGKGDMLYTSAVNPIPTRIQGTLVGDNEVERVVDYVKSFGGPDYIDDEIFVDDDEEGDDEPGLFSDGEDPLYDQALQIVVQAGKASASYIQRRLKIGYNRAARLVEDMEARGIVGPANGSKPREVIHVP
ncbi:MAG: hypothetical protein IJ530_06335 [Treponema sp.]|uniref:DNA translocase FtsK n=1 Tax=Treponema sp. TaxID=166 RepID=UPI0025E3A9A3|nr:DNA translocase FtsK [Treponema sp.]MBQ8679363.1 hypothetical protein [Treponema sp.]